MSTTPTNRPSGLGNPARTLSMRRTGVIGSAAAVLVTSALWAGGRAADVSFSVTPATSDTSSEVGLAMVVAATLLGFAAGWGLLAWAVRQTGRAVRLVLITAAIVPIASAGGPLVTADDAATGVLLATMHLGTGAVFLVAASRALPR